ncbi:hypothetical protein PILCRDRAFT_13474 [Piloderma croceum F 1598]|uniref:Helicase C-terminal domain-containing protein n=1 Tax=Piloderma croceum (strain F 1598) TaxID=765440 RepID=A0A0C3F6H9_PILCF|nr:hypothetical protein PILCRDRAFT_13474 [Piloderma croceum F 1598]
MSAEFRDDESMKLKEGETWGLCCTESFGMGMDLPDIKLIIQWRASCDLCTLWQHFGRAVCDLKLQGQALFLVESKYFDAAKKAKAAAAAELKRKAVEWEAEVTKEREMVIEGQSSEQDADDVAHVPSTTDAEAAMSTPTGSSNDNSNPVSNESQLDDAARQLFEAERRTEYEKIPRVDRKRGIRKVEEIEPALDDMINTKDRPVQCSRWPLVVYFRQNKNASDHLACQPESPNGCSRCIILPPLVCCELCNPRLFEEFAQSDPKVRPKRTRNRSTIQDYTVGPYDMELCNALNEFREKETIRKFGLSRLKNSGPGLIMPDAVLKRIVDCAHMQKIGNKDDLQIETRWSRVESFADNILALIKTHCDPSIASKAPKQLPAHDVINRATTVRFFTIY